MEREIRNLLERTTQQARGLLEAEYSKQLGGTYDILSDGTIHPGPGKHLTTHEERFFRGRLVAAVEHRRAQGETNQDSVANFSRECSFTFLNRIVALRMLEAREIIKPSVAKAEDSTGFTNEYLLLAQGLKGLPDKGYRLFLESLFDEIGREIGVLFDRNDLAGQLWPDRPKLLELLNLLNNPDLDAVWGADETIGWVYQYFNRDEERRGMRAESSAPQNSREMAVRNQFFTPRYIVEFLTDNTLGRTWYEMVQGQTSLKDRCKYMVRRPKEQFMRQGEAAPGMEPHDDRTLEESLGKQTYVPYREPKDPREIRILDPACGSGHFLLYCFDLLEVIYSEAWDAEIGALRRDHVDKASLLRSVPEFILRYNLHGIDIDPRAAQIGSLALWMRAQRAWQQTSRAERPPIRKTNIVIAEQMPGETDLLAEFCEGLEPKLLARLVRDVFDRMKLAGDAGALLRIESDISEMVENLKSQWLAEESPTDREGNPLLFAKSSQRTIFEVERVASDFWAYAEEKVFGLLNHFAETSTGERGFRRRLFVEDAERGFAFLDICRTKFDVVLMNPPFGDASSPSRAALETQLSASGRDIGAAFVREAATRWAPSGYVGALLPTAPWFKPVFEQWREDVFLGESASLTCAAHLGGQILDGATVGASPIILSTQRTTDAIVFRLLRAESNELALLRAVTSVLRGDPNATEVFCISPKEVCVLAGKPFCYWISPQLRRSVAQLPAFEGSGGTVKQGTATADEFRFARAWWEVPEESTDWVPYVKTSEYSPFWDDVTWVAKFSQGLREIAATGKARVQGVSFFGRAGVTYPSKSVLGFNPRLHPQGCGFGHTGSVAFGGDLDPLVLLGFLGSRPVEYLISLFIGSLQGEAGVHPNHYEVGTVQRVPWPNLNESDKAALRWNAGTTVENLRLLQQFDEVTRLFTSPCLDFVIAPEENYRMLVELEQGCLHSVCQSRAALDAVVTRAYGFSALDCAAMEQAFEDRVPPANGRWRVYFGQTGHDWTRREYGSRVLSWLFGLVWRRWEFRPAYTKVISSLDELVEPPSRQPPARHSLTESAIGMDNTPEILVDEPGSTSDLTDLIGRTASQIWPAADGDKIIGDLIHMVGIGDVDLRTWMAKGFFEDHISRYSKARRKAPIYWQLSLPSRRYSVWLYFHRLTRDTLWRALNDFVKPKLAREELRLSSLRLDAGNVPSPSQRRAIQDQQSFTEELSGFRDSLEDIAPLWNPNLDDGVVLNFAPLWRLVPHHAGWQRELRKYWQGLAQGESDWAYIAMHLWPERVVPKCTRDRSLAIAHDLENAFWEVQSDGKWKAKKVGTTELKAIIDKRTSKPVRAALERVLSPASPTPHGRRADGKNL